MVKGTSYVRDLTTNEWKVSIYPTPGAANNYMGYSTVTGVRLEEVFTNNQSTKTQYWDDSKDFIKLANTTEAAIDISGFGLSDDDLTDLWTIPTGTTIEANSTLVYYLDSNSTTAPTFGLSRKGDTVYLLDTNGDLIDSVTTPTFEKTAI